MLVQLEGDELGSILTRSIFMGVDEALDDVCKTDEGYLNNLKDTTHSRYNRYKYYGLTRPP